LQGPNISYDFHGRVVKEGETLKKMAAWTITHMYGEKLLWGEVGRPLAVSKKVDREWKTSARPARNTLG